WASVNEADIGRIQPGMHATFTVDAFPGEVFTGTVIQVRNNANMAQNVVTYTVVVETDNSSKRLRPFLTASVQFQLEPRSNVLTIENAALRYKPKSTQVDPEYRAAFNSEAMDKHASASPDKSAKAAKPKVDRGRIWVKSGTFVRPIPIQVG